MWGVVRGWALISLWHFCAIEQVLEVGHEDLARVPGSARVRLVAPDHQVHRDAGNVCHKATPGSEGQNDVPLQGMPVVLALVPGLELPGNLVEVPWDPHSLLALMA